MNETTGDANFNFTATIESIDPSNVTSITWALSAYEPNETPYIFPYAVNGAMFKNGVARTGFTQTWNFDDDGVLAPYSFDSESPYEDPTDNRYGGYGPGIWNVYAFILLNSGITIVLQQELIVGTPEVTANFGWSQNLTNNFGQVTFTDTSTNHEIGEADSYLWTFGDGTTSTQRNPVKTYVPAGSENSYTVSLKVFAYGPGGTKVYNTHTETVTLTQPTMVPNFTWTANNQTVTFTNTSTNVGFEEPDAYLWNFGDGTTSTAKNPVHTFPVTDVNTPQSFTVSLTTRNIWEQTATVTKTVTTTALNKSGTLPVSTLRLRFDPVSVGSGLTTPSPLYFYMFDLKARTSTTKENLSYLKPTTRINSSNITWYEADGTVAESNDPLNLTRDSSITPNDQYGLSPFRTNINTASLDFKLDTSLPVESRNLINDILLTFRDVGTTNNIIYPVSPRSKLFVDVPDSFGGWLNIGYYQILDSKVNPVGVPIGVVTQAVKTMTALRPMPLNIPYFKYTFNNTVASFTSMETADSYAWNFGDGTTSTLKDPVKTFPRRGTYNVTLAVTNNGVVTRTTTEPVIVEYLTPYPVRYFKLVQNLHTGTHAFDTPYIDTFAFKQDYVDPGSPNALTFAKTDVYPNEYRVGTDGSTVINPLTSPNNVRLNSGGGFRVKSLDASNRTQWEMISDYGSARNNLTSCSVRLGRWTATGFPETVATGINYSVFVTDFVGTQANIGTATWTKLGDFTPTSIPLNNSATYNIILT
jgi:PKD repeat protein